MTTENTISSILITGTSDNDSIINFGDDVTIDSGSGDDTIFSGLDDKRADRVSINAGEGNNIVSVQSGSDSVTVLTGDGNNSIGSTSPNNAVFTGAGNDTVTFYTGSDNNTVQTGDGDDIVDAVGHNVTIDTGSGNDKIHTYRNAYDITINAGTGDDAITLSGPVDTDHTNVVQYAAGDGIDTITDYTATDSLQITSGTISGAELSASYQIGLISAIISSYSAGVALFCNQSAASVDIWSYGRSLKYSTENPPFGGFSLSFAHAVCSVSSSAGTKSAEGRFSSLTGGVQGGIPEIALFAAVSRRS